MMALLMCRELFLGTYQIHRITELLRFSICSHISATDSTMYESTSTGMWGTEFTMNMLIFRLVGRVDYDKFEYQLEDEMINPKYTFSMYNSIQELEEPDEKISLKKLTAKLRDNLKAKELLIRYYNS